MTVQAARQLSSSSPPDQPASDSEQVERREFDTRRIAWEEPYLLGHKNGPYGYFPMQIGQTLRDGRYEIVRKLGWGAHASVWLAKETLNDGHRYVAVKILTVNATYGEALGVFRDQL